MALQLKAMFWIAFSALSTGIFLFRVPGFHYDEVWISELAARIAFEPGFWPIFGMNHYTVPVLSYLHAGIFKIVGYLPLALGRGFAFIL